MGKLHLYLGKGLPEKERLAIEMHLAACASCRHKLSDERQRLGLFHEALTRYERGEPSRLRIEDVMKAASQNSPRRFHQQVWLRTAALVVFLLASFSLINRFYPQRKESPDAQPGKAMVINPLLDEEPALTVAIAAGLCADETPIFWLDKKK
jgi:anti-sigma factor RsiW